MTMLDSGAREQFLPTDSAERKTYPIFTGFMKYFPRAIAAIAHHSYVSNEKHNPGEPLHWSREKSSDHLDCVGRHMLEQDRVAIAWRALAELEIFLEGEAEPDCPEGDYKLNPADSWMPGEKPHKPGDVVHDETLGGLVCVKAEGDHKLTPELQYDPDDVAFKRTCVLCRHAGSMLHPTTHDYVSPCILCRASGKHREWEPNYRTGDPNAK